MRISDTADVKRIDSDDYHLRFCKQTGVTLRWGRSLDDDPASAPFGPEILDIEVSTVCTGVHAPCGFCYKSNRAEGANMTVETYRRVLSSMPPTVTQVALGIGDIDGNPDLPAILAATREAGMVPNITVNGARLGREWAQRLAGNCGAVAVSMVDLDTTVAALRRLLAAGLRQVNVHCLLTPPAVQPLRRLLALQAGEPALADLHALVLLAVKPKGRARAGLPALSDADLAALVSEISARGIDIGFDSCSAPRARVALAPVVEDSRALDWMIEPCEAACFSAYVNVHGQLFPCSFLEGESGWEGGLDLLTCGDFQQEIWSHPRLVATRSAVTACRESGRPCPHFDMPTPGGGAAAPCHAR